MKIRNIVIQPTSYCPNSCPHCSIKQWKKDKPDYRLSKRQIDNIANAIIKSNYQVSKIWLSGAEPLTWEHLDYAIDKLNETGAKIYVYTTGIGIDPYLERHKGRAIWIVTVYDWNWEKIKHLAGNPDVDINKTIHYEWGSEAGDESLPAACSSPEYQVEGDVIYLCRGIRSINHDHPRKDIDVVDGMFTDVSPGFAERISGDIFNLPMCKRCMCNEKARTGWKTHKIFNK